MNYVAIDAGNTHLRVASVTPETLTVAPPRKCTYDEIEKELERLAMKEPLTLSISTVVEKARLLFNTLAKSSHIQSITFVSAESTKEFSFEYSTETIGPDRVADALAAATLFPNENLIVIDSGTATTVDMIKADKTFCGGVIMPGLKLQAESLFEKTDKLPAVNIYDMYPVNVPSTTEEAIETGLIKSVLGGIERAVADAQELLDNPRIVACGGGWQLLHGYTKLTVDMIPELTLLGTALSSNR